MAQIFVRFCGGSDFVQKRTLIHSKTAAFFPRVYNVTMFHAYQILPRCCSQAMLH